MTYSVPNGFFTASVNDTDAALAASLNDEAHRQQTQIELIASENIVSRAVLDAQGSLHTNKYAEGYPGRRYYGGCEHVDVAEELAIDRAKQLFGNLRERPAPQWRAGEPSRYAVGNHEARRKILGHELGPRWSPEPWRQGQPVW